MLIKPVKNAGVIDLIKDLIITCRTTCGCGAKLVPYTKQTETTHYLLTCKAYSDKFDHPLLIAIDKNSPLFIKAEKWDTLMTHTKYHNTFGCQYHFDIKKVNRKNQFLQSDNVELKQENKQLKEYSNQLNKVTKILKAENDTLKDELENERNKLGLCARQHDILKEKLKGFENLGSFLYAKESEYNNLKQNQDYILSLKNMIGELTVLHKCTVGEILECSKENKQLKEDYENLKRHISDGSNAAECAGILHDVQQIEIKQLKEEIDRLYNPDIQNHLHDDYDKLLGKFDVVVKGNQDVIKENLNLKQKLEHIKIRINKKHVTWDEEEIAEDVNKILDSQEKE